MTIALWLLLACAPARPVGPAQPAAQPAAGRDEVPRAPRGAEPRVAGVGRVAGAWRVAGAGRAPRAACSDALEGRLAKPSCDGQAILVAHPIELHPSRAVPREPSKAVLDAVAELMHDDPGILLVRIEVRPGAAAPSDAASQRAQMLAARARADAIFQYLWRKRGVSAERLEAVGYPFDPARATAGGAWHVSLRVVQRAPAP